MNRALDVILNIVLVVGGMIILFLLSRGAWFISGTLAGLYAGYLIWGG